MIKMYIKVVHTIVNHEVLKKISSKIIYLENGNVLIIKM